MSLILSCDLPYGSANSCKVMSPTIFIRKNLRPSMHVSTHPRSSPACRATGARATHLLVLPEWHVVPIHLLVKSFHVKEATPVHVAQFVISSIRPASKIARTASSSFVRWLEQSCVLSARAPSSHMFLLCACLRSPACSHCELPTTEHCSNGRVRMHASTHVQSSQKQVVSAATLQDAPIVPENGQI